MAVFRKALPLTASAQVANSRFRLVSDLVPIPFFQRNNLHHHSGELVTSPFTTIGANTNASTTTEKQAPRISLSHQIQWYEKSRTITAGPKTRAGFKHPAPMYRPPRTPWVTVSPITSGVSGWWKSGSRMAITATNVIIKVKKNSAQNIECKLLWLKVEN